MHVGVVSASVREGDDKPHKYLHIRRGLEARIHNTIDPLNYVHFDCSRSPRIRSGDPLEGLGRGRSKLSRAGPISGLTRKMVHPLAQHGMM